MDTPQEVQVWFILPAIRKQIAKELKDEGIKQREIAEIMNVTEAAVSQYFKEKRGDTVSFSKEMTCEIRKSAKIISADREKLRYEVQRLLNIVKISKLMCSVCHEHTNTDRDCQICYKV